MPNPRRDFLRHASLGAAALAAFPQLAKAEPIRRDWTRERDEQLAELADLEASEQPPTQPPAQQWDTTWTAKITGRHRAMFDVPDVDGGVGVFRAAIWGRQYTDVLKLQPADLSTVVVLRHGGIPLIMTNEFWTTYEVGKEMKIKNEKGKTQKLNPVLADPEAKGPGSPYTLDKLIAAGAIALGCNMAFRSIVSMVEKKDKLKTPEARTKAMSMIIPGVILQPSGIFANVMAEEAGCHFVRAV